MSHDIDENEEGNSRQLELDVGDRSDNDLEQFIAFTVNDAADACEAIGLHHFLEELLRAIHRRLQATGVQHRGVSEPGQDCPF